MGHSTFSRSSARTKRALQAQPRGRAPHQVRMAAPTKNSLALVPQIVLQAMGSPFRFAPRRIPSFASRVAHASCAAITGPRNHQIQLCAQPKYPHFGRSSRAPTNRPFHQITKITQPTHSTMSFQLSSFPRARSSKSGHPASPSFPRTTPGKVPQPQRDSPHSPGDSDRFPAIPAVESVSPQTPRAGVVSPQSPGRDRFPAQPRTRPSGAGKSTRPPKPPKARGRPGRLPSTHPAGVPQFKPSSETPGVVLECLHAVI